MNLKQILEMTDKKHEEEIVYQKISSIKQQRDEEILSITSEIYKKYQEQLRQEKNKLFLRNTCSHELLLKYDTGPEPYDTEKYYCICCGQEFDAYNCNEQKASQAIKLLNHYYDYDESFQELITDIDSYIGGLYLQNPEMDIDELRSYIKEFIPLRTEKNRRRV